MPDGPWESSFLRDFASVRSVPDVTALLAAVRSACGDPGAVVLMRSATVWTVKKWTTWSEAEISGTQAAIDGAPTLTPQIAAQRSVDTWPIEYKALVLALIDALNVVRSKLPTPLPAITPAQAIQAIRDKAGAL